ncbi:hypothetical protein BRC81_02060 [Halobacteriales archaeon QS_1_68_20]|nr:MAG: hypothetical protein BRC81_02060 [Halobacteriales archaeon QS_1_68_20]
MVYVGVDHSTTGVKVGILDGDEEQTAFTLDRARLGDGSVTLLDALSERVTTDAIDRAAITYSWGNGIASIQDIERTDNRGIKDHIGAGYELGGGTAAYDELEASSVPAVVIPGVHRELPPLHPYFSHYSALAGGDKVAAIRYAQHRLADETDGEEFIWACASSSCMAGLVSDGALRGFFHWMGLMHGWPDPEALREMDEDRVEDVLMRCGVLHRSGLEFDEIRETPDEQAMEMCYWATVHNIYSLVPFAHETGGGPPEAIALTGRLTRVDEPDLSGRVAETCSDVAPTYRCGEYSSAYGAAHVARDVDRGEPDVLGIPVAEGLA